MNEIHDRFRREWPEWFTNVRCGFHLPAHWEPLLRTLCRSIELGLKLCDVPITALEVAQVKEKFCGLRFYYRVCTDNERAKGFVEGAVSLAESMSYGIDDECNTGGE